VFGYARTGMSGRRRAEESVLGRAGQQRVGPVSIAAAVWFHHARTVLEQVMSHATSTIERATASPLTRSFPIDFVAALLFVLLFAIGVHAFQYHDALAESDLYRVLVGLMDGANSGQGIASNLQYDHDFGFGYLAAFYAFADPGTLRDPDKLMALMNQVGFWFMLAALLCFWSAVTAVHGARAGTVALIIFGLAPMVPELGTSGHQVIPMFAFLCAGATLLLLPLTGWRAVVAACGGGILLLAGLMSRGEIFLAFPWIVLSRVDTRSVRGFIVSGIVRSIAPATALVVFLIMQHQIIHTEMGSTVGDYYTTFYTWANVIPGLVYMTVGSGIATTVVGGLAGLWLAFRARPGDNGMAPNGFAQFLGPVALVLVPLVFFAPNPIPARHFLLTLAGLSILIAVALTAGLAVRRVTALAIALVLGVANQVLGEVVRQPLLAVEASHSPLRPIWPGYQVLTHANAGWEWTRHDALVERRKLWQALGNKLHTACQDHTMILSDEGAQLFSRLYAGGVPVEAQAVVVHGMAGRLGVRRGKTFLELQKMNAWPKDPAATMLADPAYDQYKVFEDPYTMSKFDRTPIPPDRVARFGCPDPAQ
jgi:hypothetical protein